MRTIQNKTFWDIELRKDFAIRVIYWLSICFMIFAVTNFFMNRYPWENPQADVNLLMRGMALRPYVYRVLAPFVILIATHIYPLPTATWTYLISFGSLLGFTISVRSFAALYWDSPKMLDYIGLISIVGLIPFTLTNEQVYDFPTLFLFTLGLNLLARSKWRWFIFIYILGCLNKETTLLLSLVFVAYFWESKWKPWFWKLLTIQMAIFAAIRMSIMWIYRNNPGGMVEFHWPDHLAALRDAPILVSAYIILGIILIFLAAWGWSKKPLFLRRSAIIVPTLFFLYLIWGYPLEIRVFYEAYPIMMFMILQKG